MINVIERVKEGFERNRQAKIAGQLGNDLYEKIYVEEPSDEAVLAEYGRYRKMGGRTISEFEIMQGSYVEPPTLLGRAVKLGGQVLKSFGSVK